MRLSVCGTIILCDNAEPRDTELTTGYLREHSAGRERLIVEDERGAVTAFRPGQGAASGRTTRSGLRLVHQRLRHARSEGSEGAAEELAV
jgi:hypothetical protein